MAQNPSRPANLSALDVIAYLRDHPDFLLQHPELVELLTPPARHTEGGVVDLQNFMLRKLQNDNVQLRTANTGLLHYSRENLTAQQRIHSAVISLLSAINLEDLLHIIASDLVMHLGIDAVNLCFETNDMLPQGTIQQGIQVLPPLYIDEVMGNKHILFRDESGGDPLLFPAMADIIKSDALIRLYLSDTIPDGVLVLGSREKDRLHSVFGSELLAFLGQIIEITVQQWLDQNE